MIENNIIPKVSVGIAVYNVEIFLTRCLDSMMRQTLNEMEIIIVDDGSSDNCASICDRYAEKDGRFRVIHKKNGGLASARQTFLENAKGEYIAVCDGDDWVAPSMYESLYNKAVDSSADMVMCDYWGEYPDGKQVVCKYQTTIGDRSDLLDDALNKRFPTMVWNKLFKRELFDKYNIAWEQGINMGEDLLIMLKMLCRPMKVVTISSPLYHYRRVIGGTSYTNSVSLSTYNQLLRIRHWSDEHIEKSKYGNGIFIQWLDQAFAGLRVKEGMTSKYYKDTALNKIQYSDFFRFNYPRLKGLVVFVTKLLGYKVGKSIVRLMYRYIYH